MQRRQQKGVFGDFLSSVLAPLGGIAGAAISGPLGGILGTGAGSALGNLSKKLPFQAGGVVAMAKAGKGTAAMKKKMARLRALRKKK